MSKVDHKHLTLGGSAQSTLSRLLSRSLWKSSFLEPPLLFRAWRLLTRNVHRPQNWKDDSSINGHRGQAQIHQIETPELAGTPADKSRPIQFEKPPQWSAHPPLEYCVL